MLTVARVNVHNTPMRLRHLALLCGVLFACHHPRPAALAPSAATDSSDIAGPPGTPGADGQSGAGSVFTGSARPPAFINRSWPLGQRTRVVTATHAMVVSSHPLATEVGLAILQQGGNAVDAAVAVGFALAVVHPVAGNIGGGGFMMIRLQGGTVRALDYREMAPALARRDMFVDSAGTALQSSLTGHLSVGVPGSVAGMYEAHHTYGRLPWADVVAPAIRLAREGFVLDAARSRQIALEAERLVRFPASRAQFLLNGAAPEPGTRLTQPDLARTLELISDSGPAAFYEGAIADLIVQEMQRGGGLVTKGDLEAYRAKWRTPVQVSYRGYTIYTMPPPSGGGIALAEILNVMEGFGALPDFGTATLLHLEAEAMRRAYLDRNAYLGDPDYVQMPLERLLSKSHAAELRAGIDPRHATPPPAPAAPPHEGTETTHYSIVDPEGNAVSCTTTLNNDFGSAVTVGGAGFLLNDEMDDFTSAPGRPNLFGLIQGEANAIAPGKRMLSAMTPSIVLDSAGRLLLVLGSPGGSRITTAVFQIISNVIDQGMTLPAAIAAPRLHDQGLPDMIYLERDGFTAAAIDSLTAMGHKVTTWNYKTEVNAIARTDSGWVGVADPRRSGGASGY